MIIKRSFLSYLSLLITFVLAVLLYLEKNTNNEAIYDQTTERYQNALNNQKSHIESFFSEIDSAVLNDLSVQSDFNEFNYPCFLFKNGELLAWNDHNYPVDFNQVEIKFDKWSVNETQAGLFLTYARFINQDENSIALLGVLPLERRYQLSSKYLSDYTNPSIFGSHEVGLFLNGSPTRKRLNYTDQESLYVEFIDLPSEYLVSTQYYMLGLILSFISFLIFSFLSLKKNVWEKFSFLVSLILLRYVLLIVGMSVGGAFSGIFDPLVFAYSNLIPSLGDLILHVLFVCIALCYLIRFANTNRVFLFLKNLSVNYRKAIFVLVLTGFYAVPYMVIFVFRILFQHSAYNFNILDNITFDAVRVSYMVLFILITACFIFALTLLYRVIRILRKQILGFIQIAWVIGAFLFAITSYLSFGSVLGALAFLVFIFLLHYLELYKALYTYGFKTYVLLVLSAVIVSLFAGLEVSRKAQEKAEYERNIVSEHLLYQRDPKSEFFIKEVSNQVAGNHFIKRMFFSPGIYAKKLILQKVKFSYLKTYFDQFDGEVLIYDIDGKPFLTGYPSLDEINKELDENWYNTGYVGQYFKKRLGTENSKYLQVIPMKFGSIDLGFIVLQLQKKNLESTKLLPALLGGNYEEVKDRYDYAVFNGVNLRFSIGKFDYTSEELIAKVKSDDSKSEWTLNGYLHYLLRDSAGNTVVVSSKDTGFKGFFDNFAFGFLLLIIVVFITSMVRYLILVLKKEQISYTSKIQIYLNLAFSVPLLVVSVTVISVTNSNDEKEAKVLFEKKSKYLSSIIYDKIMETSSKDDFRKSFKEVAYFSQSDLSVFNADGKLIAASQPLIYDAGLLSSWLNPIALKGLSDSKQKAIFVEESIGDFSYKAIYIALLNNETGQLMAILRVPSFQSTEVLERNKITVFTSILEIFTFIFIVIVLVSQFSYNALARPLQFIAAGIRKTSLSEKNEPLSWEVNDEIGALVFEYNDMIEKLEQSKNALARTEKESAWREMAQQVAHEIKNPLTPMKLKLQHLIRVSDSQDEKQRTSLQALLEQVDTLSDIATSFSSFAKMPTPVNEKFNLSTLIKEVVELFENEIDLTLTASISAEEIYVNADRKLFSRIFANLIINGKQASQGVKHSEVRINVQKLLEENKVMLSFEDKGLGIPEEIQHKVFLPNFTTKETGSGIGLAIAKRGVEHAGGKIWFKTIQGSGTTFNIELPLV